MEYIIPKNLIKIQYMSDLHLEIYPGFRILPEQITAEYLVLAGDIGDPSSSEYIEFITDVYEINCF